MSTENTATCTNHGHSYVESSLGKGPEPSKTVYLFCQKCGEVKTIDAKKSHD